MKLGFGRLPKKEDYEKGIEELVTGLEKLDNNDVLMLLLYGSVARGDFDAGRSDIDLIMVLGNGVITDKNLLLSVGRIINGIVEERNLRLEMGVVDLTIARDGRFLTYDSNFRRHFSEGRVLYGDNYRDEMNFLDTHHSRELSIGFNLQVLRKKLVESVYTSRHDLVQYAKDFESALIKMKGLDESTLHYIGKAMSRGRFSEIEKLSHDVKTWNNVRKNPGKAEKYWKNGLTTYEEIVKELIYGYQQEIV